MVADQTRDGDRRGGGNTTAHPGSLPDATGAGGGGKGGGTGPSGPPCGEASGSRPRPGRVVS